MTREEARRKIRARLIERGLNTAIMCRVMHIGKRTLTARWQRWSWRAKELVKMRQLLQFDDVEMLQIIEATEE